MEKSELVRRVTAESPAVRMPPAYSGLKLSDKEIQTLRSWVEQGAKWQRHWSFLPPVAGPLPSVSRTSWPRNPIDNFVLAKLEKVGLQPSPEANKATLIRRASLDLTGMPPTPAEVDAFLRDSSPNAWEKVVDRLLASPRYGEKMAIRWLDAARYADTNGYQTDAERHHVALARLGDRCVQPQHAVRSVHGRADRGRSAAQCDARAEDRDRVQSQSSGNSEGGIVPEEYPVEYAVDRVDTMSTVFLGVTLGCARCHNHKYDPFTQREYYQLFAYFNNIPELGRYLKYGNTPPHVKAPTREQASEALQSSSRVRQPRNERFKTIGKDIDSRADRWERTLDTHNGLDAGHAGRSHRLRP